MSEKVSTTLPLRRSTRRSISASSKVLDWEPTVRAPLKRKKSSKPQPELSASNGTNDNDSEEEGSPNKKACSQTGDAFAGGDRNYVPKDESEPMETQNEIEEFKEYVKPKLTPLPPNPPVPGYSESFKQPVVALQRCSPSHLQRENVNKTQDKKPKINVASPSKCITQNTPTRVTSDTCHVPSMKDYRRKMEAKITASDKIKVNHHVLPSYPASSTIPRQRTFSTQKRSQPERKQDKKKTTVPSQSSSVQSKGLLRYRWQLILLILLSAGLLLVFTHLQNLQRAKDGSAHSPRSANAGLFVDELSRVVMHFPSQRPDLWKRSQIHLQKHLDTPHPTEPVSLILTAGLKAEKTLQCLAHKIASAFSSALNASVIVINGASRANLDSDQVKMDIDTQLKAAFESDKLAAVVHRFEELPPGSTLIFYRYCDHETAAYKQAFLLFTVLLSLEDLSTEISLKGVEEMVRDHIEERFVGNETAFNKMDADKFSGLWSRIAHLTLPVAYEEKIEQRGC